MNYFKYKTAALLKGCPKIFEKIHIKDVELKFDQKKHDGRVLSRVNY